MVRYNSVRHEAACFLSDRTLLKAALQAASAEPFGSVKTSPGNVEDIRLCLLVPFELSTAVFVASRAAGPERVPVVVEG